MDMSKCFIILFLLLSHANELHAASWSDVSAEVVKIFTIYQEKSSVIPLQDLTKTLNVSLGLHLLAINDFDDVAGIMDISTYLFMEWTEEIYVNAYGSGAPDTSVTIPAASIWKPSLILVNSAGESTEIVQEQSQVRIYLKSGKCEWSENVVFKASCKPNVYFYPFDVHDCSVKFTTRSYKSNELTLLASSYKTDHFEESVTWNMRKTSSETLIQDYKSHVKFQITISRRSLNYVLNYILPILILSGLNIFVFILPRRSGERAGYSVTCFLAFVVFMNTIVTSLPKSSAPVSVLVYYLTVMMAISAVITVLVLITMMIDRKVEKEEDINKEYAAMKMIASSQEDGKTKNKEKTKNTKKEEMKGKDKPASNRLCCWCCASNNVEDISTKNKEDQSSIDDKIHLRPPRCLQGFAWFFRSIFCMLPKQSSELRWVQIGNTLDVFFFVFFIVGELIFSVAYLAPVSQQYSAENLKLDLERVRA
ncbi:hypothetical protein CHS0354_034563 [Potamilus streckersoni]|uniref:Uncharacterized protein n=1 Tax=Potamilus streckersoni TaxID=2493646 RepID=A0AAE0RQU8_9BIVA|nr:hypothetical protein CHS0354_034563 [Potamilus streckersoni]